MANNIAFQPMGNTTLLAVTTSSGSANVAAISPVNQFMIANTGNAAAFINMSTLSNVTVTQPVAGTPGTGFCIPAGQVKVVSSIQSSPTQTMYFAGIASSNTTIYITPGEGL